MDLSVHVLRSPADLARAQLEAALNPAILLTVGLELPSPPEYRILVAGRPRREHLVASPNLRAVIVPWTGIPDGTLALMAEFPHLALHNLHYNAVPTAETAVALMLAAAKFVVPMDRALRAHDWTPRYRPSRSMLLEGRTALILGYGTIGRRVGRACQALGMRVMATRRRITEPAEDGPAEVFPATALPTLLPSADVLIICLPETEETTGLIDAEALAMLPAGAVLVNVGRGPVVDQAALYDALHTDHLRAAGLDVWYNYPPPDGDEEARADTPPSTYPFHELDNVVLSPHRAGHFAEREILRARHLAEMLNAAARGEPMPNRVDRDIGY